MSSNRYDITVKNQSGSGQKYALFSEVPNVTGKVQSQIWSNVFAIGNAPADATTNFAIYKQFYAVVGTSNGSPSQGVSVNVSQDRKVSLGKVNSDGTQDPGTTLQLTVNDDAPTFAKQELAPEADPNAFAIKTDSFIYQDAVNNNWLIGLGSPSHQGGGGDSLVATFVPSPNVTYNIQPTNTYYIVPGNYSKSDLFELKKVGQKVIIDFTQFPSNKVVIVHDATGKLIIQKQ